MPKNSHEKILFTTSGMEVKFQKDSINKLIHVRREDGISGMISYERFEKIIDQIGKPCLACSAGTLEYIDFQDINNPYLVCSDCDATHVLRGEELSLLT